MQNKQIEVQIPYQMYRHTLRAKTVMMYLMFKDAPLTICPF